MRTRHKFYFIVKLLKLFILNVILYMSFLSLDEWNTENRLRSRMPDGRYPKKNLSPSNTYDEDDF